MLIFHGYVSLPEDKTYQRISKHIITHMNNHLTLIIVKHMNTNVGQMSELNRKRESNQIFNHTHESDVQIPFTNPWQNGNSIYKWKMLHSICLFESIPPNCGNQITWRDLEGKARFTCTTSHEWPRSTILSCCSMLPQPSIGE